MNKTTNSRAAGAWQKPRKASASGRLTRKEVTSLVLLARDAHIYLKDRNRVDRYLTFDEWRHEQVEDACGKTGISKMTRSDYRTVKAHFLCLMDREAEAFQILQKTGTKSYRPTSKDDTWEASEAVVFRIREALSNHESSQVDHPGGHITADWFLAAARQRTGKPSLNMDSLAERLDAPALTGLLAHLRNHIATREGRDEPKQRSARTYSSPTDQLP